MQNLQLSSTAGKVSATKKTSEWGFRW